ncbi:MAG: hypothetical protein ACOH1Y_15675 [Propionicimonas sp.]
MVQPRRAILGDLAVVPGLPSDIYVLAEPGASLAQVRARQVPRLNGISVASVVVHLGPGEVRDGYDESAFHADVVALCDVLLGLFTVGALELVAIPEVDPTDERTTLFNASARVTADLRGIVWRA